MANLPSDILAPLAEDGKLTVKFDLFPEGLKTQEYQSSFYIATANEVIGEIVAGDGKVLEKDRVYDAGQFTFARDEFQVADLSDINVMKCKQHVERALVSLRGKKTESMPRNIRDFINQSQKEIKAIPEDASSDDLEWVVGKKSIMCRVSERASQSKGLAEVWRIKGDSDNVAFIDAFVLAVSRQGDVYYLFDGQWNRW
ncbi:hypothetical protein [Rubritalea halochordaticola]